MENEFTFEPSQKPKKFQKFNEDIIILNNDDSFEKKENNEEINEINENPIFTLTIELEMGKTEKLDIYKNSDPYNIANNFCIEHNLGISTFQYLKEKIDYLIEEYKNNKNLDVNKCMNDINKDFNEKNNNYIIEENNENISQNISNENMNNIIIKDQNNNDNTKNKLDYFSYFLNRNKNKSLQYKNSFQSKGKDINNNTIKNNNRNNDYKKIHQRNKSCKTDFEQKYKKELKLRNDINQYLDSKEKSNNNMNQKVSNYYDYYKSSIQSNAQKYNTQMYNGLKSPKDLYKIKLFEDKKNIEEESYINKMFKKKEITRKKSAYFRSLLSKNESFGRNITRDNTYSSSKINLDSITSNRTNSKNLILSGIKFNKENPVILNNKPIQNYGQYLFEKGQIEKKEKQNEINEIQRLDDLEQFKSCSFKPKTNYKRNRNVHSKYMNKNNLILNEEKYEFKPKINNNYKTDLNFQQRQTMYMNLYKKKNEEMKKYFIDTKYDEKGHELFKPKLISRQIQTEKNIDVFNKNYSYYKKYNLNKNRLEKKYYNNDQYLNGKNICSKQQTNKIMNDLYSKIFKSLFNDLDSDHDDLITSLTINLNEIPKYILNIIEPILKELKEDEQTLNCEEFILVMKKLFEDTSMLEKQKLINYYQNKNKLGNNNSYNNMTKRNKTPYHFNLNSYYKNFSSNNNSNDSRTYSSKDISINNQNENKEENDKKNNDDFKIIYKDSDIGIINDKSEINNGFDAISKYTFNNYLKQIKPK